MSLILAIEADRRQSNLLATIGRQLGAELIIAATAEAGLAAVGGRVPDLVLTSALLSPADDTVIGNWLRDLDERAAHVQTLTVPVLAKPSRRQAPAAGLLGKLRGGAATSSTPAGCDPALFAAQVSEYLARAAAERRAAAPVEHADPEPIPVIADAPAEHAGPTESSAAAAVTTEDENDDEIELADALNDENPAEEVVELQAGGFGDLDAALKEFSAAVAAAQADHIGETASTNAIDATDGISDSSSIGYDDADEAVWAALEARVPWPTLDSPDVTAVDTASVAAPDDDFEVSAAAVIGTPVAGDERPATGASTLAASRLDQKPQSKRPPRRPRPAQDEWGFFDPEQCGFSALLQKLEEIATSADDAA